MKAKKVEAGEGAKAVMPFSAGGAKAGAAATVRPAGAVMADAAAVAPRPGEEMAGKAVPGPGAEARAARAEKVRSVPEVMGRTVQQGSEPCGEETAADACWRIEPFGFLINPRFPLTRPRNPSTK